MGVEREVLGFQDRRPETETDSPLHCHGFRLRLRAAAPRSEGHSSGEPDAPVGALCDQDEVDGAGEGELAGDQPSEQS